MSSINSLELDKMESSRKAEPLLSTMIRSGLNCSLMSRSAVFI